ncbi:uncharacterized protein LOC117652804 [Thrips palmi]|uniref:Uncharacterized protein LOC117652804 n=1 Tax=Thrips palmi TaxID=161013 RepID=A0A6P9A8F1_THRPL|nr:uncharacterized protein LOC117652804 [Thrips palmi]
MSVYSEDEILCNAFRVQVNVNNGHNGELDKKSPIARSSCNAKYNVPSANFTSYDFPSNTVSSCCVAETSNTLTAQTARRLQELETELRNEQERRAKVERQLAQCLQMLADLRGAHSQCPIQRHFDELPEEIAITIFSYLSVHDLVDVVSKVNKKWNRLAHDVVLWSQMSLDNHDINDIMKLMNFAPCLRSVCIPSEQLFVHDDAEDTSLQVLTQSPCRLRSLTLPDFQPISLRMIRNQMGNLRHLQLNSWWDNSRSEFRDDMWTAIFELDLVSLALQEYDGGNSYFHSVSRPVPGQLTSLRHLDLYCKQVPGGILSALLEACKNSLETVALPPKTLGADVALLSKCPRLREANVPFLREVCALEANPMLELVEMNAEWVAETEIESIVNDVACFLHMPSVVNRLRTLFFQGMPVQCRQLLHATAGVRGLRYVRIHNFGEPEVVDGILEVLEGLPDLERFVIATLPPPAVLDAIGAHFCPKLKELCFIGACSDDNYGCRIPAIKRLLQHRPQLHVFLDLGLGVVRHLEGAYPDCLREHRTVCSDESRWHRVHPVLVNHEPDSCTWCRYNVEAYATVADMRGKLDVQPVQHHE